MNKEEKIEFMISEVLNSKKFKKEMKKLKKIKAVNELKKGK